MNSNRTPSRLTDAKPWIYGISQKSLVLLVVLSSLLVMPSPAWSLASTNSTQAANSTQSTQGPNLTTVNLTTGAVATFVIVLLGLAAAILVMGRFLIPKKGIARRP